MTMPNGAAQAPSPNTVVRVDTRATAKVYSRMIFGGFLEHFDNQIYGGVFDPGSPLADEQGFRLDVIAALKELRVPVIRWPGGCFVDSYHWRKGVGPKRQPYGEFRWGVIEPNTFGTHEFVEFCRCLGCEPYICHNGVSEPRENVDWVLYCNATAGEMAELRKVNGHPEPLNVRYWSVGNERSDRAYIDRVRDTAKAMKAFDPKLQIMCSGSHGGTRATVADYLFDTAGGYLDLISIHNYWLDRGKTLTRYDYMQAVMKSEMPDLYITDTIGALQQAGHLQRLKISFDEWNLRAWQHPGFPRNSVDSFDDPDIVALVKQRRRENDLAEQYTMADALFSASFLNACLRHSEYVVMAAVAPLLNTRGPLFVHPDGIVKRTHFHTMAMYANLLQERVADAEVKSDKLTHGAASVDVVDAIATVDASGVNWAIALVNRHPSKPVACEIRLGDAPLDGVFRATLLTADSADAYNDIDNPGRVVPRRVEQVFRKGTTSLPPHSLMIVEVPRGE